MTVGELEKLLKGFTIEWGVESRDRQFKDLLKRALDSYCFETGLDRPAFFLDTE